MQKILLINAKGGCGKSTIACSLAAYYSSMGVAVVLTDYDPQASATSWLKRRPSDAPSVSGIAGYDTGDNVTRSWQMRLPPNTEKVIIDSPAGLSGIALAAMVDRADTVLIPVLPSPIDIHATAHFIEALLLTGKARLQNKRIGVVANRIRQNTRVYSDLERFLSTLRLPLVTRLRDTQNYVQAFQAGLGIHELPASRTTADRVHWTPLIKWLNDPEHDYSGRTADAPARGVS